MQQRRIGSLHVSSVGLGTNNFGWLIDERTATAVAQASLDAGINHFDTADVYGGGHSEEILGRALGSRRDEAVIATKFGANGGGATDAVRTAVEGALDRLGTDRIDLLYLHVPDPTTPIAETLGALEECIQAGKVLEVASSNVGADQVREADAAGAVGKARFVAVQNELSLLDRADEPLLDLLDELHIAYVPYFPLANGMLTGKYRRGESLNENTRLASFLPRRDSTLNDRNFDLVERLEVWAGDHGHSIAELAIAWLAAKPAVASVIAGATTVGQVAANAAAATWTLTPEEVAEVDTLTAL